MLKDTRLKMKSENLEMNLFLKLVLISFDFTTEFKTPPEFKENAPNNKTIPTPQVLIIQEDSVSDSDSDIDISSDEDEDE